MIEPMLSKNFTKCDNDNTGKHRDSNKITFAPQMKYKTPLMIVSPFKLNDKAEEPINLCSLKDLYRREIIEEPDTYSISSEEKSIDTNGPYQNDEELFLSLSTSNNLKRIKKYFKQIKLSDCCKIISKDDEYVNLDNKLKESFDHLLLPFCHYAKHAPNCSILSILQSFSSLNDCL